MEGAPCPSPTVTNRQLPTAGMATWRSSVLQLTRCPAAGGRTPGKWAPRQQWGMRTHLFVVAARKRGDGEDWWQESCSAAPRAKG